MAESAVPQEPLGACQWLKCFCIVDFDLEYGQKLDRTVPDVAFSQEEISNMCFLSFPDSNTGLSSEDTIFTYRVRTTTAEASVTAEELDFDSSVHWDSSYFYGFVFFRQQRDTSLDRGYLQKSVVIVTRHAFVGLFKKLAALVGPLYFEHGIEALQSTFKNIAAWPEPRAGQSYELPVLGSVLRFHVPHSAFPHLVDRPLDIPSQKEQLVSNLQSVNIYATFHKFLPKLWLLWELVLTGEPLLLLAPHPTICSDAVLGLVSLISPLTYGGDFRPFFTIHDTDFKKYTNPDEEPRAVIIGATNPFFFKAMDHWPHIVTIDAQKSTNERNSVGKGMASLVKLPGVKKRSTSGNFINFKQEVKSSYRTHMASDPQLLKNLVHKKNQKVTNAVNNEIIRRHFVARTEMFLVPLERYFTSLMPLQKNVTPFHKRPRLKPWDNHEFLRLLTVPGQLVKNGLKMKQVELYRRFVRSPNFKGWYNAHRTEAVARLRQLYRNAVVDADLPALVKGRKEVEVIDLYMRITEELAAVDDSETNARLKERLQAHVQAIHSMLPEDLRRSLAKCEEVQDDTFADDESAEDPNTVDF